MSSSLPPSWKKPNVTLVLLKSGSNSYYLFINSLSLGLLTFIYLSSIKHLSRNNTDNYHSLHKKWSFPLRISSVNVTKSTGHCGELNGELHFLCSDWFEDQSIVLASVMLNVNLMLFFTDKLRNSPHCSTTNQRSWPWLNELAIYIIKI